MLPNFAASRDALNPLRSAFFALLAVIMAPFAASNASALSFAAQQTFAVGAQPHAVIAVDLNGDGKPDLVAANAGDIQISVLLNTTGRGAATASFTSFNFQTGLSPSALAAADFDGDGKSDLAVVDFTGNDVVVLLNTTPQGAAVPSFSGGTFLTTANPISVVAMDVDGDHEPDMVLGYAVGSEVSVFLDTTGQGATKPRFGTPQQFASDSGVSAAPRSVAVVDVNGDGKPDLVVGNSNAGHVAVLLNTTPAGGALSFAPAQVVALGSMPTSVACFDVDGDGRPDIVTSYAGAGGSSNIGVLLNTTPTAATSVSFAAPTLFPAGSLPESFSGVDLDGDGKPDLLFVSPNENVVSALVNATAIGGVPNFAARQTFAVGRFPLGAAAADINGDGKPDLITANSSDGTLSVLLNTTPAAIPVAAVPVSGVAWLVALSGALVFAATRGRRQRGSRGWLLREREVHPG